jgi:hypothetical protein
LEIWPSVRVKKNEVQRKKRNRRSVAPIWYGMIFLTFRLLKATKTTIERAQATE